MLGDWATGMPLPLGHLLVTPQGENANMLDSWVKFASLPLYHFLIQKFKSAVLLGRLLTLLQESQAWHATSNFSLPRCNQKPILNMTFPQIVLLYLSSNPWPVMALAECEHELKRFNLASESSNMLGDWATGMPLPLGHLLVTFQGENANGLDSWVKFASLPIYHFVVQKVQICCVTGPMACHYP
jgi:hypothetical protein